MGLSRRQSGLDTGPGLLEQNYASSTVPYWEGKMETWELGLGEVKVPVVGKVPRVLEGNRGRGEYRQ